MISASPRFVSRFVTVSLMAFGSLRVSAEVLPAADSFTVKQLTVHLMTPRVVPRCLDSAQLPKLMTTLKVAIKSDGNFLVTNDTTMGTALRLTLDTLDGLCQIRTSLDAKGRPLEAHQTLSAHEEFLTSHRLDQVIHDLAWSWYSGSSGKLQIRTSEQNALVRLNQIPVGRTPLGLDRLKPGTYALEIQSPGWLDVREPLRVQAGLILQKNYSLQRSLALLDSLHNTDKNRRRDSFWNVAKSRQSKALEGLYAQLLAVDLPVGLPTVAILPFSSKGHPARGYDPGLMAAEYGAVRLARDHRFTLVERADLQRVLGEQALSLSGAVNDSSALQTGRLLAARYLITGTVQREGSTQTISARMVFSETGEIVSAAMATVDDDRLEDLYRTAIGERGQLSASLFRSAAVPGWGQFYTGHTMHGSLALGAAVAALGWIGWSTMDFRNKDDKLIRFRNKDVSLVVTGETDQQWVDRAEAARVSRNEASTQVTYSLAALAGVWLVNLVDAGVLGYLDSRSIRSEYFATLSVPTISADRLALSWRF